LRIDSPCNDEMGDSFFSLRKKNDKWMKERKYLLEVFQWQFYHRVNRVLYQQEESVFEDNDDSLPDTTK
jgi:hypothetical protein